MNVDLDPEGMLITGVICTSINNPNDICHIIVKSECYYLEIELLNTISEVPLYIDTCMVLQCTEKSDSPTNKRN